MPLDLFQFEELGWRFTVTLTFVSILLALARLKNQNPKQNTYTYFVISVVVFFLCFTLNKIDLNLGMALGLFAIFGIIRYRTEAILAQEMTYLFAFIGVAVINALAQFSIQEVILINLLITLSILAAQKILLQRDIRGLHERKNQKTVFIREFHPNLYQLEKDVVEEFERAYQKEVEKIELNKIDHKLAQITFHLYYK